jgi:hypothetical protein
MLMVITMVYFTNPDYIERQWRKYAAFRPELELQLRELLEEFYSICVLNSRNCSIASTEWRPELDVLEGQVIKVTGNRTYKKNEYRGPKIIRLKRRILRQYGLIK